ncbi:MAG: MiaB/RimO family radical SAM methylthiotransferase, partial [Mailhella sp.]|nr:MiaB/RimO family radical SAM methylthiotransferase [Mailhella sp.]
MKKNFKFFIRTYGCRVNQYESQSIRERWLALGGEETGSPQEADVILVSTCAVTAQAVSDARQDVRQLAALGAPRLIVAGCAASAEPGDFAFPGVSALIPQKSKHALLAVHPLASDPVPDADGAWSYPPFGICAFVRSRPVVKVQDGCSQGCAYCIVPLTRGPSRSRPAESVEAEVRRLLNAGYRELTLSGINLRQYHAEGGHGRDFWALLRHLDAVFSPAWQGRARFRLSSLDPAQVAGAEGLETLEQCRMVCPHLHLSLQSGSPSVLRRMGRSPYSPEGIAGAVAAMKRFWPLMGLGADILMGFPGETDAEVEETLAMVRALPLTYAHVFPYSPRPGTRAAALPGQLGKRAKQEHALAVRTLAAAKRQEFLLGLLSRRTMLV